VAHQIAARGVGANARDALVVFGFHGLVSLFELSLYKPKGERVAQRRLVAECIQIKNYVAFPIFSVMGIG
jgi:hypothetical protein